MNVRQVGLQAMGLVARKGLLALSFLLIARGMGPTVFGSFSYVYTWVYIFALISSLGFTPVSTREVAHDQKRAPQVLVCALGLRFVASVVSVVLLIFVMFHTPLGTPDTRGIVLILAGTIPPLAFADQLGAHVMGFGKNSGFALINAIQWGLYVVATAIGVLVAKYLATVLVLQLIASWISAGILAIIHRKLLREALHGNFTCHLAWYLTREAAPLAMTNLLGVLYFRLGGLQLFRMMGPRETGFYTSSLQVVEGLQLIPMALTGAAYPLACRAVGTSEFSSLFQRVVIVLVFFALFIASTASTISSSLIRFLFGGNYAESGYLLHLLVWAAIPTFLHYAFAYFLIAVHKQSLVTLNALVGVAVSFTANMVLISRYGTLGAVYSSIITESSICILHAFFVLQAVRLNRRMILLAIPAIGALLLGAIGAKWSEFINSTALSVTTFSLVSGLFFTFGFVICNRLRNDLKVA